MAEINDRGSGPMHMRDTPIASIEDHPRIRQYLSLQRLSLNELPPHPEFPASHNADRASLPQFLNIILAEAGKVDFDNGWTSHGKWHPQGTHIQMPVLANEGAQSLVADAGNCTRKPVPISVDQRVRVTDKATWVARTSYHLQTDVNYSELDELLSQDHGRNEARYTPSVYDANELLTWSRQDLEKAVGDLRGEYNTESVQMSIFQMFHTMPEVGGLSLLEDRVFHVLIVTAHSTCPPHASSGGPRSFTVQIPVDIESLSDVNTIRQRSHVTKKGSSRRYHLPSDALNETLPPTEAQKKKIGKKLTEGNYVSLERLCKASKELLTNERVTLEEALTQFDYHHRWDMST
ncbi:uncharacterized protein K460DRAFT_366588 [Cucurbitaria berberidis CBS 394.84]|uniref:DUF3074 domain-containing protein n=1 Tax=Cucurbitaria berberidis CBS 394.84 TaxID=1168544 RepID=A0A9P4L8V1_9PLEO|nr:uncharacterized protein K460DRAFT_366588 [Cucurbitaria berberidis CBS 394.84]KAF1845737.1 hypothetical protein K460DRAFT_366588 [Cucurbitaria berberidis CBS 394.84]